MKRHGAEQSLDGSRPILGEKQACLKASSSLAAMVAVKKVKPYGAKSSDATLRPVWDGGWRAKSRTPERSEDALFFACQAPPNPIHKRAFLDSLHEGQ
jgi:hypothetical protein